MIQLPPEKLGSFYLGAKYDNASKTILTETINYDARDLTTHAVCVGMTGSGKTGLCIGLLEEAALDKVPALIIDPKGDMTNLMLQFDQMEATDFEKWVNADDAARKGLTKEAYAASMAEKWTKGLAEWGQDKCRVENLKNAVDYTIYTPGSDAGVPVNILGSFSAPKVDFDSDAEMLRERIQGTVAALLGMIESKADPVRSREGILLSTLFEHFWRKQEDLDLAKIIMNIQKPPVKQLGVFDVDTFFPEKDRFELAMEFNTLMASPQFSYWLQGDALDIEKMYFTAEGKPRHSIFYIAHLSESERMFFVTLLLNSLITWMRRQSGTTSLRSLVYFDEIFGYFPPTAQPPSKKPLLTILKQARAFGVGAVLVTQNPVDIDYKGLSNAGTWFIGKLQTERDKQRVLEGLEGAIAEAGIANKVNFSDLISALSSRVFLLHNVHDAEPIVYHTRWAMSYLRGPLTRPQVKELMLPKKQELAQKKKASKSIAQAAIPSPDSITESAEPKKEQNLPPALDSKINQRFFAVWKSATEAQQVLQDRSPVSIQYMPEVLLTAKVRFYDSKRAVDEITDMSFLSTAPDEFGRLPWDVLEQLENWDKVLKSQPDHPDTVDIQYTGIPNSLNSLKDFSTIEKAFADWLYQNQEHHILEHDELDLFQQARESEEAFKMRVQQAARELRDDALDELQERYAIKFDRIEDKIRKKEHSLDEAKADKRDRKTAEMVTIAETLFSVFAKGRSRSFSSAATKRRMRRKASEKVEAVKDDLMDLQEDFEALEAELKMKLDEITVKWDEVAQGIQAKIIKPRRSDVKVDTSIFVWHPYWVNGKGERVSARV